MPEFRILAKHPLINYFKTKTNGLHIANDTKELMIDYLTKFLLVELDQLCSWAVQISELQGKRTIQNKEWEFILSKILDNDK